MAGWTGTLAGKLILLAIHGTALGVFLYHAVIKYEWVVYGLLYTPIAAVRIVCLAFLGARTRDSVRNWRGGVSTLLSSSTFPTVAPYLQACVWTVVFTAALCVRPWFFHGEVTGWRDSSPCGKSSCTREPRAEAARVYNPHGYFPRGDQKFFDRMGLTEYSFCDWKMNCRWAEAGTGDSGVKYLTEIGDAGSARTEYSNEGFVSSLLEDYPNLGWGIRGGYVRNEIGKQAEQCPGEGTRVCSTCSLYSNTFKGLLGISNDFSAPEYIDLDVTLSLIHI